MLFVAVLFFVLLAAGIYLGELSWRGLIGFLVLAGGLFGAFVVLRWPPMWYVVMLAVFDMVLVLWVFKGNLALR